MTTICANAVADRWWCNALAFVAVAIAAGPSIAQKPTDAEIAVIRKACRSDYIAHCRSVPTGGAAALNCLKQNYSQNSPTCQQALRPVTAPSAPAVSAQPGTGAKPAPAKP
ncbi:MAG: cysteine rich repeat-containing protein [Burkholderiaceae bacterium]